VSTAEERLAAVDKEIYNARFGTTRKHQPTLPGVLKDIAAKLTDPGDRETYGELIAYFSSLPEHDEMFRLAELLGLLTLVGQHIPDAIGQLLEELRGQSSAASNYRAQVEEILNSLPTLIVGGVDVENLARGMGERFRQQISSTGLAESANALKLAARDIKEMSTDISSSLAPAARDYAEIATKITRELAKLGGAVEDIRRYNAELKRREEADRWWSGSLILLFVFCVGAGVGLWIEKEETTRLLQDLATRVERIQATSAIAPPEAVVKKTPKPRESGK
jgi:hypothetical protein